MQARAPVAALTLVANEPYISPAIAAGWQSGYAEDCKSSYSGSIPLPASIAKPNEIRRF